MNRDLRKLLRAVEKQGFTVRPTRSGHLKVVAPTGALTFVVGTPSDCRSIKNTRADLRRMGAVL